MQRTRPGFNLSRLLVAAYEPIAMVLGLGFLALLCALWSPIALPLHLLLPKSIGQRFGRWAIHAGFRIYLGFLRLFCLCRFDLKEVEALRDEGSLVIVANHPSLLDAVIIIACLPNVACVMKSSLMDNPLLGAGARLAGYIRNDSLLSLVRQAKEQLHDGAQLLIFPEGTRTDSFPISPCTGSAGLIASRAKVPVQTLLIDFSSPYLGKRWPLLRRPELPLSISAHIGQRFAPPADAGAFAGELETYFRETLSAP
ncbi:MAG TPA: lysophospholipid acyltransferase family protein [Rhodocyclaceae bacterium]|nr:lysophospholipid acyltransferase family protein [Rhodocyclaceae bacterium]